MEVPGRIVCVYSRCCTGKIQRPATRHTYYINPIDIRAVRQQHPAAVEPHRRPDGGRPFSAAGATFSYIIFVHARTHITLAPPIYTARRGIFTFLLSSYYIAYSHTPPPSSSPQHRCSARRRRCGCDVCVCVCERFLHYIYIHTLCV